MYQNFGETLNLPKTEFPMRGSLTKREPLIAEKLREEKIYNKILEKNEGKPRYILHDGPPYANGDIHLGTVLNKVLKDIIIKYKNMSGYLAPYVPGWDTHGLPIELKAIKELGLEKIEDSILLREKCKSFAMSCVDIQKEQFIRLGVLGDFDNPYLTLNADFEAKQIEVFGAMIKKGYIYKGLKPVYWCADCHTALAEAEIEYYNDPCYSIFVKFNVKDDKGVFSKLNIPLDKISFLIWTTTIWTLPANVAICIGSEFEYSVIHFKGEYIIVATNLVESVMSNFDGENYECIATFKGSDLELITTYHPFLDRESLVILGSHVTLESGTGCVHTAPGHGPDDYQLIVKHYNYLPLIVPVDDKGIFTEEAGVFSGLNALSSDTHKKMSLVLQDSGKLFYTKKIFHQYPHCWRCKNSILFRATPQWFCSVNSFKDEVLKVIDGVEFEPKWGKDRMRSMVADRSDWCISRQRVWGVPIPIFYCTQCNEVHVNDCSIKCVVDLFREEGSNSWYYKDASEILDKDAVCNKCGNKHFYKEMDIMDVWFDSGVSHSAVLSQRDSLSFPADLYIEGGDQYRGWFQSSLLTSVAYKNVSPYKNVYSHGWVVDGKGKKMSKSLGNGINPKDVISKYGADILRLWVASSNYQTDVRISEDILKQLSESYRKIRNTARFILGNLYDFDPNVDIVALEDLEEIDKFEIIKLNKLLEKVKIAYDNLEFHTVYHSIHQFCVVDLSNFYLDILKDRLYVESTLSKTRCCAQTTIYILLSSIIKLLTPILSFTADEIWEYMPKLDGEDKDCIFLNDMPKSIEIQDEEYIISKWDKMMEISSEVKKSLECKRKDKVIGASLDAKVTLGTLDAELYSFLLNNSNLLSQLFIVSGVEILNEKIDGDFFENIGLYVNVSKFDGEKCERCWSYFDSIGFDEQIPNICKRCASVLSDNKS